MLCAGKWTWSGSYRVQTEFKSVIVHLFHCAWPDIDWDFSRGTVTKYINAKRSIPAHPTFVNDTHRDLHLWTVTSKSIGFTMVNMSAKFDKEIHNGLVSCSHAYFHICPLWPWPLTFKINRVHPLTMPNMSAKFDQEAHNGLVSIVFTSLFPYMSIVTLTFDLWPPKSIGFILSPWWTRLPSLIKKSTTVKSLSCSQAYFHICPLWPWPLTSNLQNQ